MVNPVAGTISAFIARWTAVVGLLVLGARTEGAPRGFGCPEGHRDGVCERGPPRSESGIRGAERHFSHSRGRVAMVADAPKVIFGALRSLNVTFGASRLAATDRVAGSGEG
ncbi:hypothetical protein GCM10009754_33300 [Amycolatopsis minnesotensis]|uniref:Uncharacterized protein n=1 Tax=Amycolatopsis minnesotensis TaxID=337894 RepID=A0ABP5CA03_9PSEU